MPQEIKRPKPYEMKSASGDVAREALVSTQSVITKIKEEITQAVANGDEYAKLTQRLNNIIAKHCKAIANEQLREETRKALVSSAKKWFWQLGKSVEIYNRNLEGKTGLVLFTERGQGIYANSFRPVLTAGNTMSSPLISDYRRQIKIALKALAAEPPKIIEPSNGKPYVMSLRLRAEMAVRYEANMENLNELRAQGVRLAWTSSHPNASPRCAPYQGRLWSLDGTSGVKNGIKYLPIEVAMRGSTGDGNGIISGYNCRHRLIEYKDGSTAPKDFTPSEIKKEYEVDQKQRSMENRIRELKTEERLMRSAGFNEEAAKLRKQWRRETALYKAYSLENNRAFYPYRYIIDETESGEGFVDNNN